MDLYTKVKGVPAWRWLIWRNTFKPVYDAGGDVPYSEGREIAREAGYPNGNLGGYFHGSGPLKRVGKGTSSDTLVLTPEGYRDMDLVVETAAWIEAELAKSA